MDSEYRHSRRRSGSKTSRRSSSLVRSESSLTALTENFSPPDTAVIKQSQNMNVKANLTTGLNVSEIHYFKNTLLLKSNRENLTSQRGCLKMGSVRPITSRRQDDRFIQDRRYFLGVIHLKIRELTEEISRLHWQYKEAQQEKTNAFVYETKAKELAAEITSFQTVLADLNLAFDFISTTEDIEKLELEARKLEDINNAERNKIELLFSERKLKEDFVNQIEINELTGKKNNESSSDIILKTDEKYNSLNNRHIQSSRGVKFWERQIEQYNEIRSSLNRDLEKQFPYVNEVLKLESKLFIIKKKVKEVAESSTSKSDQQRQMLLEKVKQDKSDISTMELNINDVTKNINDIKEIIGNTEDPVDGEVKTQETMDQYMTGFENVKEKEIKKLNVLETELTDFLSELRRKLSCIPTEADYMNLPETKIDIEEFSDELVSIPDEHKKILNYLKKVEIMEINIKQQYKYLDEKCCKLKEELEEYITGSKLNTKIEKQETDLINKKLLLELEKPKRLAEIEMLKKHLEELQQKLSENEKHKELLYMEEGMHDLEKNNTLKKQSLEEMKTTTTYLGEIRNETLNLMKLFNIHLINNTNG